MIIDSHAHLSLDCNEIIQKKILDELDYYGINLIIISDLGDWSEYPDKNIVRQANIQASKFAGSSRGRAKWLAYLNPQLDSWHEEFLYVINSGAIGFKLWISLKDSCGCLDNTLEVLKEAGKQKIPVLLHVYNRTDENLPGEISIDEFAELSQRVPECTMIAGHSGGNWRYSLGILKHCSPNAYFDISGGYPEYGMLETLIESEGADRILFGSDIPCRSFSSQLSKVQLADISKEDREKILWQNAAKVFRINDIPAISSNPDTVVYKEILPGLNLDEDHFCFCGNWPFFNIPSFLPADLEKILQIQGIAHAFVADIAGLFRLDLYETNTNFYEQCKNWDRISPLAVVNPAANNWGIIMELVSHFNFAGILVSPYMHNWNLIDPKFKIFFDTCAEHNIKLWLNCAMADYRFRHPAFLPRPVLPKEVLTFIQTAPENKYIFQGLGAGVIDGALTICNDNQNFQFEISKLTDIEFEFKGIINKYGFKQMVLGSEFPLRHLDQVKKTFLDLLATNFK